MYAFKTKAYPSETLGIKGSKSLSLESIRRYVHVPGQSTGCARRINVKLKSYCTAIATLTYREASRNSPQQSGPVCSRSRIGVFAPTGININISKAELEFSSFTTKGGKNISSTKRMEKIVQVRYCEVREQVR